ncbi:protein IFH1-like isoform X2 [Pecten maximus]|uniref:protein IFH1-like isoform X2 n=1 Tax=Pecten maximus TaxID=6579 RepID=UPI0014585429|nr:protein IFH1-like isoform X2 [Pecten maximus]
MEKTVKNKKVIKTKNRIKTKQKNTDRIVEGKNSVELVEKMDKMQSMAEKKPLVGKKSDHETKKLKQNKDEIDVPDVVKSNRKMKSGKTSDNLTTLDNLKKKKRKMSLSENTDHTNLDHDQEPLKKKKKKKSEKFDESEFKSGHKVLMEKSTKCLSASASDELPSDVSEKNKTNDKNSDVKKGKKRKSVHESGGKSQKHLSVRANDELPSDVSEEDKTNDKSSGVKKAKKNQQTEDNISEAEEDSSEEGTSPVVPKKKKDKKKKKKKEVKDTQDGAEDTSISAQTAAIDYLKTWSEDKVNWKFQKVRQVWLLQHMYDDSKVPNTDFDRLLLYLENLKGKAKEATLDKASKIIEAEDSSSDEDNNEDGKTMRARQVMQMLN